MRKITKSKKLKSKAIIGLSALVLAGTLVSVYEFNLSRKEYEHIRIDCSSDGFYSESRQFKSYDPSASKSLPNTFVYYGKWEQNEDGTYMRAVKEYGAAKIKYEDISNMNGNLEESINETLGEPTKEYEQVTEYVTPEELNREAHYEATLYDINYDRYVTIKEQDKGQFKALVICTLMSIGGMAALIAWRKKQDKEDNKKLVLEKREN